MNQTVENHTLWGRTHTYITHIRETPWDFQSSQSRRTQTFQWTNQNSKRKHAADTKREKTYGSESRLLLSFTYDSMKKRREFLGRQSLGTMMQNQSKHESILTLKWKRSICLLSLNLRYILEVTTVTRRYTSTTKKATFLLKLAFL